MAFLCTNIEIFSIFVTFRGVFGVLPSFSPKTTRFHVLHFIQTLSKTTFPVLHLSTTVWVASTLRRLREPAVYVHRRLRWARETATYATRHGPVCTQHSPCAYVKWNRVSVDALMPIRKTGWPCRMRLETNEAETRAAAKWTAANETERLALSAAHACLRLATTTAPV